MSYESVVDILPSSIYEKGTQSTNRKLWKLFSDSLDDIENGIRYWYDKDNLSGEALDKMGLLKGIPRNGLNDDDYRYELSLPRTLEIVSIPSIYDTLSVFGTNPRVRELHSPYLFDIDRLDAGKLFDGTWNLFPAIEPAIVSKLNGSWILNGEEPLEAYGIRRLALLISIETDLTYEFQKVPNEIKKLLAAITVYYQFFVNLQKNIDFNFIESKLDGTFLMDGSRLLTTEIEAIIYNGVTELYRVPVELLSDKIIFNTLKRNYTITKFEIERSGEVIASQEITFQTSVYLQYQFIIK
ncbi:MAG: hypothetical protein KDK36_02920 [Leptospiraceae bacterium]|nr:hypothetical protein [Leptospiraceae bacterium]